MDWDDIIDRRGTFEFISLGKVLHTLYTPEDIQSLVDTFGVVEMVRTVNEAYQKRYHTNAVQITNNGGDLKVIRT